MWNCLATNIRWWWVAAVVVCYSLLFDAGEEDNELTLNMASQHTYKLKYFPLKARGEPIRYLFAYAGVPYEDIRIPTDQWPSLKPTMPFGKVPVLEVDGKVVHQSRAICRYLGNQFSLVGADDWENLQIDIAVDTFEDFRDQIRSYYRDEVPESKAAKLDPLLKETLPFYLSRLDEMVKSNGGHMADGKLTWADFYFAGHIDSLSGMLGQENIVANYPNLKALYDKIHAIPNIAAHVAKRLKTTV